MFLQCHQVIFIIRYYIYYQVTFKGESVINRLISTQIITYTLSIFKIRLLEENGDAVRASGLCIELGNALLSVGKNGEAASFYQRAADLRSDFIGLEYVHAREKVASCQIGTY